MPEIKGFFLWMCSLRCNHTDKANVLIDSVSKEVEVTNIFKEDNFAACIHANVAELLMSKEECFNENSSPTKCKVILTDGKQHLAISFDGITHGLIFANIARGAKRGHCLKCDSIRCSHLKSWDLELKKSVLSKVITKECEASCDRDQEINLDIFDDENETIDELEFEDYLQEKETEVTGLALFDMPNSN